MMEEWLITLISIFAPILSVAGFMLLFKMGDFFEWLIDDEGWIVLLLLCLGAGAIGGVVCGFIFWIWWAMLLILLPIIALIVGLFVIVSINDGLDEPSEWAMALGISFLSAIMVGGITTGFIFWNWWIMLIITIILLISVSIIGIVYWRKVNKEIPYEEMTDEDLRDLCIYNKIKNYKKLSREKMIQTLKEIDNGIERKPSSYKCKNCGSNLTKIIIEDENGKKIEFECSHCNTEYSKKEMLSIMKSHDTQQSVKNENVDEIELTDFEEEYFVACKWFKFRPYNAHTKKQIESRYKKIQDGDDYYGDDEEIDNAYEYLIKNLDDIENYMKNTPETTIKKHYDYFLMGDDE